MNNDDTQLGVLSIAGLLLFAGVAATVLLARAAKPLVDRVASVDLDQVSHTFGAGLSQLAAERRALPGSQPPMTA